MKLNNPDLKTMIVSSPQYAGNSGTENINGASFSKKFILTGAFLEIFDGSVFINYPVLKLTADGVDLTDALDTAPIGEVNRVYKFVLKDPMPIVAEDVVIVKDSQDGDAGYTYKIHLIGYFI